MNLGQSLGLFFARWVEFHNTIPDFIRRHVLGCKIFGLLGWLFTAIYGALATCSTVFSALRSFASSASNASFSSRWGSVGNIFSVANYCLPITEFFACVSVILVLKVTALGVGAIVSAWKNLPFKAS